MMKILQGGYSLTAGLPGYQKGGLKKINIRSAEFEIQEPKRNNSNDYYINVKPNGDFSTFDEVDKIPGKYALKDGSALSLNWWFGTEYRYFEAAESTEDNPVLIARGVNEDGKIFEQKINLKQIDPYNATWIEINALGNYYKPDGYTTMSIPYGGKDLGAHEKFDFITGYRKYVSACRKSHLV